MNLVQIAIPSDSTGIVEVVFIVVINLFMRLDVELYSGILRDVSFVSPRLRFNNDLMPISACTHCPALDV